MNKLELRTQLTMSKPEEVTDMFGETYWTLDITQSLDGRRYNVSTLRNPSKDFVIALGRLITASPELLDLVNAHTELSLLNDSDTDSIQEVSGRFIKSMRTAKNILNGGER